MVYSKVLYTAVPKVELDNNPCEIYCEDLQLPSDLCEKGDSAKNADLLQILAIG